MRFGVLIVFSKLRSVAISHTYREDEVENEENVFAEEATSVQSHDDQRFVLE